MTHVNPHNHTSRPPGRECHSRVQISNFRHAAQQAKHAIFLQQKHLRSWWTYRAKTAIDDRRWAAAERRKPFVYVPALFAHTFLARPTPTAEQRTTPPVLWAFWLGGKLTAPRKAALAQLTAIPHLEVRIITEPQQVVVAGHPLHPAFDRLAIVHQTDYLRAYVMHHVGGVYTDVKSPTHALRPIVDGMNEDESIWVTAYREITSNYVPELGYALGAVLKRHYRAVMGPSAFACRPRSVFTTEWMRELEARMNYYRGALNDVDMTAKEPYDHPPDYPVRWSELLGDIIQPLSLKHQAHIRFTDDIRPQLTGYR